MQDFQGKVAVITGAGSGIGKAIAERCAREGMRVVLAGINAATLDPLAANLKAQGAAVLAVPTDVSKAADIEALARQTLTAFGQVDLLVNNAGVAAGQDAWEATLADWEWALGVNLYGVIHALRTFVPIMLAQGSAGHIVNVSSIAGLLPYHPSAPYLVSKQAVVGLSEQLYYALKQRGAKIHASVLCPGFVTTRIMESDRNRPAHLANPSAEALPRERMRVFVRMLKDVKNGLSPEEAAEITFAAIRAERFYILTHPEINAAVRLRVEGILGAGLPPEPLDWSQTGMSGLGQLPPA